MQYIMISLIHIETKARLYMQLNAIGILRIVFIVINKTQKEKIFFFESIKWIWIAELLESPSERVL